MILAGRLVKIPEALFGISLKCEHWVDTKHPLKVLPGRGAVKLHQIPQSLQISERYILIVSRRTKHGCIGWIFGTRGLWICSFSKTEISAIINSGLLLARTMFFIESYTCFICAELTSDRFRMSVLKRLGKLREEDTELLLDGIAKPELEKIPEHWAEKLTGLYRRINFSILIWFNRFLHTKIMIYDLNCNEVLSGIHG